MFRKYFLGLMLMFPNTAPMIAGPSAPDPGYLQRLGILSGVAPQMPYQTFHPAGTGPGWDRFMQNARPSTNIEDHRR
jgi:hypothetical protein